TPPTAIPRLREDIAAVVEVLRRRVHTEQEHYGLNLSRTNLSDVWLMSYGNTRLMLENSQFRSSLLVRARLDGADLKGADFRDAVLWDANLIAVDLTDAKLDGCDLRGADMRGAI